MGKYKDSSIWSLGALRRGFFFGREQSLEFRKTMERGGTIDDFMDAIAMDTSGQYGLVSPIGELVGFLTHPIHIAKGGYYHALRRREKRYDG